MIFSAIRIWRCTYIYQCMYMGKHGCMYDDKYECMNEEVESRARRRRVRSLKAAHNLYYICFTSTDFCSTCRYLVSWTNSLSHSQYFWLIASKVNYYFKKSNKFHSLYILLVCRVFVCLFLISNYRRQLMSSSLALQEEYNINVRYII